MDEWRQPSILVLFAKREQQCRCSVSKTNRQMGWLPEESSERTHYERGEETTERARQRIGFTPRGGVCKWAREQQGSAMGTARA